MKKKYYLHPIIIFLLIISTIILLIYSLGTKNPIEVIRYFSFLYSTIVLIITILNIKRFYLYIKAIIINSKAYQHTKNKLFNIKIIRKYFEDLRFKNLINLSLSTIFNLIFIFINFINGIINKSLWFTSLSIYYLFLTIIKIYLLTNFKSSTKSTENNIYKYVGYLLMLLNLILSGVMVQMIIKNKAVADNSYMIYLNALYSFYLIISAIINVIKYRKYKNKLLTSVKIINFFTATVSIFMLQTTLLATFGANQLEFIKLMNTITGSVISILTLGISSYMIIKSNKSR